MKKKNLKTSLFLAVILGLFQKGASWAADEKTQLLEEPKERKVVELSMDETIKLRIRQLSLGQKPVDNAKLDLSQPKEIDTSEVWKKLQDSVDRNNLELE